MDRQRVEDEQLVARYLASQLDETTAAAFEQHYLQNPDVVKDIERTLRLREGLAILQERGELAQLVQGRPRWHIPASLAAGLVMMLVGVWIWVSHSAISPVTSTLAALRTSDSRPLSVISTHVLARVRGGNSATQIALPRERGAIELRMVPSALGEGTRFTVELRRLPASQSDSETSLGKTAVVQGPDEAVVTAYLDSARLTPGRYAVELIPEHGGIESSTTRDRFELEIR